MRVAMRVRATGNEGGLKIWAHHTKMHALLLIINLNENALL